MKNKNWVKIALDIVMAVLLVLMYDKRVISMRFHEVGGLIVCGLFLIHKGLNFKWIVEISKRITSKKLPIKTKIGYIINILLLLAVTFIGISGVMISKTVLMNISSHSMIWQMGHQAVSGIALILVGIHVGLHWIFIKGMFKKIIKIPGNIARTLGNIMMLVIIIFGVYSMGTSNFVKWITMPITTMSIEKGNGSEDRAYAHENSGNKREDRPEGNKDKQNQKQLGKQEKVHDNEVSVRNIVNVIGSYISIISTFAIITYQIEKRLKK